MHDPVGLDPSDGASESFQGGGPDGIRRLTTKAVAALTGRGLALNLAAFLSSIALAHFLTPRQFGLAAVALAVSGLGLIVGDGGMAAGMIRMLEEPTRKMLGAAFGFQLFLLAGFATALGAMAAWTQWDVLALAAVAGLSAPLSAAKIPAVVVLERRLEYGPIAKADLTSAVVYYATAIGLAAAGAGAWSLAIAPVCREIWTAFILWRLVPAARVRPRWSVSIIRPMLGFGAQFQAIGVVHVLRDQGVALLTGALGGLSTAGYSSLMLRMLQIPFAVLNPLWRVSYSAYARLATDTARHPTLIERSLAVVLWPLAFVCVGLGSAAEPIVQLLFGSEWSPAADALPWACLGIFIGGAASVTCAGYLLALGRARLVLLSGVCHTIVTFAVIAALVPRLGATAVGITWLANGLVEAVILTRATIRLSGARLTRTMTVATLLVASAIGSGEQLAHRFEGEVALELCVASGSGLLLFTIMGAIALPKQRRLMLQECHRLSELWSGQSSTSR